MTGTAWLAFLAAAAIGASARYVIDGFVHDHTDGTFPWGTLVVNVSGCLVLGVIAGLGLYHGVGGTTRTVFGTGGMGAYTTFSTFTFETIRLAEEGEVNRAMRNVAANFVLGLAASAAGLAVVAVL